MWNTNEHNGKVDQAKGKVKQAAGTLIGDDDLKAEGQVRPWRRLRPLWVGPAAKLRRRSRASATP
jgi:hypothetical protein